VLESKSCQCNARKETMWLLIW